MRIEEGNNSLPLWSDGTPVWSGCQYAAFAEGEPHFPHAVTRIMPQCVQIRSHEAYGKDFLWMTNTCINAARFICQVGAGDQEDCSDGRCGPDFPVADGVPGECDVIGPAPCCSADGRCGDSELHCDCPECVDYSLLIVPDCPPGYHKLKDTCYGARLELANYTQAERACAEDGGTLAMPKHLKTDFFLIGLMIRAAPEGTDFWIGIDDRNQDHVFADGHRLADCAFTKWSDTALAARDSPNNCYMYSRELGYFWHSKSCLEESMFLCQIGPGITEDCPTTTHSLATARPDPPSLTLRPPVRTTQGHGANTAPAWPRPGPGSTPPPLWPRPGPGSTPPFVPLTVSGQGGAAAAREQHAAGAGGSAAIAGGTVGAAAAVGVGVGAAVLVYKKLLLTKVVPIGKV
ncbi:hypothetical protein Bbelb_107930 [Branchiostoma belcheri]|nr:hypothetical protein Bbelb_107930 [Branchiostoma belcheri]